MKKLVSNSLSPNLTFFDGVRTLFSFGTRDFFEFFGTSDYLLASSARTLFGAIADFEKWDKHKTIALPAFCCAVMATPFLTRGYRITWLDTDERGLISVDDFARKLDLVACVVVPHIFGQKAPIAEIVALAKKNHISVIEDCAHLFNLSDAGADYKVFSFGREKVYSCISGGAMLWRNPDFRPPKLKKPSLLWTFRHLLQILVLGLAVPTWFWGGKVLAGIFSKLHFFPRAVTPAEKSGTEDYPSFSLAPFFQRLLFRQLKSQKKIDAHRAKIAKAWQTALDLPSLPDYPLRAITHVADRPAVLTRALQAGFDLKDWEGQSPIAPNADYAKFGYTMGSCPHAENFSQHYLTLPTNIRTQVSDVERFAKLKII